MTKQEALQEIRKFKYTGNCYMENSSRGHRVMCVQPGSKRDEELLDLSLSSSKWTCLGHFREGISLWTRVHEQTKMEFDSILNGEYDLKKLIDKFNTSPLSLTFSLREALMAVDAFCSEDINEPTPA